MTVTLNHVGGFTAPSGSPITTLSGNQTTATGDSVLVVVAYIPSTGTPTITATCGGSSMSLLGTEDESSGVTEVVVKFLKIDNVSSGTPSVVVTASAATYMAAQSFALSGVGSWGTTQATGGAGTTATQTTTGFATGDLVINAMGSRGWNGSSSNTGFTTLSGGTNQAHLGFTPSGSFKGPDLVVNTATADTTFAAAIAGGVADFWAALSVVAGPVTGLTLSPASATVTITGQTPAITLPGAPLTPTTATVHLTGGTPNVLSPITPTTAHVTITPGTPVVSAQPFDAVLGKLSAGTSVTIQVVGDSTAYGQFDGDYATRYGWPGRLALALGMKYNATVVVYSLNYPSNSSLLGPTTIFTASGGGRPTISMYNLGWPGATFSTYSASPSVFFPAISPDVVITNTGFNENSGNVTTNYQSLVGTIQTAYPNVPVVVTTENATVISQESGHGFTFAAIFLDVVQAFIPSATLPLSPALQKSTNTDGVWVIDTLQAHQLAANINPGDGLHPIGSGYSMQAEFMLSLLAPGTDSLWGTPASASVALTRGTPSVLTGVLTTVTPTTATVALTGGTPAESMTANLVLAPTRALVGLSGGTPILSGIIRTLTPTSAHVVIATGTPTGAAKPPRILRLVSTTTRRFGLT